MLVFLLFVGQSHASRLRTPHAEAGRLKTELPRPMGRLVLDLVDTDGIFEHHPVARDARSGNNKSGARRRRIPLDD